MKEGQASHIQYLPAQGVRYHIRLDQMVKNREIVMAQIIRS